MHAYLQHVAVRAESIGIEVSDRSFAFSVTPDGSTWLRGRAN
jgi:hypothetical protein